MPTDTGKVKPGGKTSVHFFSPDAILPPKLTKSFARCTLSRMAKILTVHNLDRLPTRPIDALTELQDDFKEYTQTRALADRIAAVGFKYPAFIWQDGGTAYVLDAHSRLRALRLLQEDGWQIPPIPVVTIQAESLDAAKVEVLHLNSRYAEIQAESAFWQELQAAVEPLELEAVVIPELEGDDRPMIDFATDDSDDDTGRPLPDATVFPLAIVLTQKDFLQWQAVKQALNTSDDTRAFVKVMTLAAASAT